MTDFAGNISRFRGSLSLSRAAFAEPLGASADKIKHIESGQQRADHEILAALRTVYGVDLNALLTGDIGDDPATIDDPSFVTVPKFTVSASAGNGGSFVAEPLEVSYYAFNLQWIKRRGLDPSQLHIVTVKGDSMEPTPSMAILSWWIARKPRHRMAPPMWCASGMSWWSSTSSGSARAPSH